LIIGNGESVLGKKLGQTIDDFPVVGRLNNYSTDGFTDYIGSKTDIWFNGANQNLVKRKIKPDRVIVLIPLAILEEKGDSIHLRIQKRLQLSREQYEMVPAETMKRFEMLTDVQRPSTGTGAILWACENFDEVYIHGFDFFISSKGHYNDSRIMNWLIQKGIIKKGHKHDMPGEKAYVESLLNTNRVRKFSDNF